MKQIAETIDNKRKEKKLKHSDLADALDMHVKKWYLKFNRLKNNGTGIYPYEFELLGKKLGVKAGYFFKDV